MKILIVDDQADIRDTLQDILEINGYKVVIAEDGAQGLEVAAKEHPDFIFCDISMPTLDGHGMLAAIKEMPAIREVPFVFLTANAARQDQREGMALGADDYITKPFTERDILDAIAARTTRQRSLREKITELTGQHRREINAQWSHELLTPLNGVLGALDLIEMDEQIAPAELKEMLALIREGAQRQEKLSRKLIRYFGLEQMGQARPVKPAGRCQAADAIQAGVAKAEQERKAPGVVRVTTADGAVALPDEFLRDAVCEVVANALIFSPAGSPVTVSGTVRDGSYRIETSDQGPGLTAEQRAQIGAFTQFERQKREQQGLGLGLAIAQKTAQLAGGSLTLENGAAGRGLRVIFTLPLAAA